MKFSLLASALIVFNPTTISARYTGNRDLQQGIPFIEDENEEVLPFGFDKERMMIKYVNKKGRKAASTAANQVHLDIVNLDLIVATKDVEIPASSTYDWRTRITKGQLLSVPM